MSILLPIPGSIFSFKTTPLSEFSSEGRARYSAFKVLGVNKEIIAVSVLDAVWDSSPAINEVCSCSILRQFRFSYNGELAVWGVPVEWWTPSDLEELIFVGSMDLGEEERKIALDILDKVPGSSFSPLDFASSAAEGEWRWVNDRDAFIAEQQQVDAQLAARRLIEEERNKHRLQGLTLDHLLNETPFENWSWSTAFPSPEFTQSARHAIHNLCRALRDLGNEPQEVDVRRLLKQCVEFFNEADERAGGVIETEEREDICEVLEEIARVVGHDALCDELHDWRDW